MRTIWVKPADRRVIQIIDQRCLPHRLAVEDLQTVRETERAIREMRVRGAPLIGVTAAYGMYLAALEAAGRDDFDAFVTDAAQRLGRTRPTAVNLRWAVARALQAVRRGHTPEEKVRLALETAERLTEEEVEVCRKIGEHGLPILEALGRRKQPVQVLTHCNAGWLACVEWGTATSPIYQAFDRGIGVHVWVTETRPRNQGASLTAWELGQRGIPHTVVVDSAAGHLMQRGLVDLVLVGTDRTTRTGDVANKIGTYLIAVAAKDNRVPFYVALPASSIDWNSADGLSEIPIEQRSPDEVTFIEGAIGDEVKRVRLTPVQTPARNDAFDVTPRRFVSGFITERGIAPATEEGLSALFPEGKPLVPGTGR